MSLERLDLPFAAQRSAELRELAMANGDVSRKAGQRLGELTRVGASGLLVTCEGLNRQAEPLKASTEDTRPYRFSLVVRNDPRFLYRPLALVPN